MQSREVARELINFFVNLKRYMQPHVFYGESQPITEQQFRTMIHLMRLQRCTLKELSESLNISSSSLCIMLNKLWKEGYITRESDTVDRRNTFYSLSEAGLKFLNEDLENKLTIIGNKIDNLSDSKKERLIYCMKEFQEILEEIK